MWVFIWFGFMILYTTFDIIVWRKIEPFWGKYLNLFFMFFCMIAYLVLLTKKNNFRIHWLENISFQGIGMSFVCAILFYIVLDKGFDPILEKCFPASEESYQQMLQSLRSEPVVSLLQICVLAPIIEEVLMRGFLLGGLSRNYGKFVALLISAFLFAVLHFNMAQTLSAFVCGIVLGLLYLRTGSIFCCILAHAGYNLISYIAMIAPLYSK